MRCSEGKLIFELSRSLLLSFRRSENVSVYLVVLPLLLRAGSPVEQRQFSGYRILANCACSRRLTDREGDHDRHSRHRAHSGERSISVRRPHWQLYRITTDAPEPIRASALRLLAVRIRSNILSHHGLKVQKK